MEENQIVVENPKSDVVNGIIWEYSMDNSTWQESNVFNDYAGQPFVEGQTYPVYAVLDRATPYERRAFTEYTFGLSNKKVTLDVAAKNGRRTAEVIDAMGFETPEFEEVSDEVEFVLTAKTVITDNVPREKIKKKSLSKLLDFPAVMTFMEGDEVVISRNEGGVRKKYRISPELLSGWTGGSAVPTPPSGGIPTQTLTEGTPYIYELLPWNNANEFEVKDLPAGLTFNNSTRRIYGTPTASGNYIVTVTGISAAGIRKGIAVAFVVQAASISRDLEGLSFVRTGTNLKWTLKGEGGPEGIRIKQGTDSTFSTAPFFDMQKVGNRTYEFTYQGVVDGEYTVRAELKIGTGAIQEEFTLEDDNQNGIVFPGQVNLLTGKSPQVSSGADQEKINNLNLSDSFATDSEFQPAIGFASLVDEGQKARQRISYIHTDHPEDFRGQFIIVGENLSVTAGSFQANYNRQGIRFWQIPQDATSPIKIDLDDYQASSILVQRSDTGPLRLNEWQVFGDYPVINHPPVINTITNINRAEGQAVDENLSGYVTDRDGDTVSLALTLKGGFTLPSWMSFTGGRLQIGALPWEGGNVSSSFEYTLVLVATDEHGSATSAEFKLVVQKVGTLESLQVAYVHYDYISTAHWLLIGANVTNQGPMRVNLIGNGFIYGGSGWKTMENGTHGDFSSVTHNKILNAASPVGFSGVEPGNYEIQFQEFEGGPIVSRALEIPSSNIGVKEVYKKADQGTTTPTITSISHVIDANGKPIVNVAGLNITTGIEVAIVQLSGGGWSVTGFAAATAVSGNNFQRAYNTAAPQGSYRYDVRITGTTAVQSGTFTIGASVANYVSATSWREVTTGTDGQTVRPFFYFYTQTTTEDGAEWQWLDAPGWRAMTKVPAESLTDNPVLSGSTVYIESDYNLTPVSTVARTIQIRKPGTEQVANIIVPAGYPPHDVSTHGPFYNFWTADVLVTKGIYSYDANPGQKSAVSYFEPKVAGKQYEIFLETDSGAVETGSNFGSGAGSGAWSTGVWLDLVANTSLITQAGTSLHRRWEKGDAGTGLNQVLHRWKIREKGTVSPVQIIPFTPPASNQTVDLPISAVTGDGGGGTTPTPVVGAKIMLLGDSIMTDVLMRTGLKTGLDNANIVSSLVGTQGSGTVSDPRHEGHVGYTIAQTTAGVAGWINAANPDIVVVMIGTNNANNAGYNLANVPAEYGTLLDTIFATKSNVRVIVSNIPPRTDDTFNARVTTLNNYLPAVVTSRAANGRILQYVGAASSINRLTDMSDGTHLNATGSAKLANGFLAGIQSLGSIVPSVSQRLAAIREVYYVKHAVSWVGDMADLKAECETGFSEGLLTGVKMTLSYHDAVDSAAWAAFKGFYTWVTVTKKKKFALHLDMKFDKNHAYPSSVTGSTSEQYTNNGGTEEHYYTPSMSQNDGFTVWRGNGDTTNWQPGVTPKRILFDTLMPRVVELEAIAPIWYIAQGRTHTGEGGYNSRVDALETAMYGGNEDSEKAAFKTWLYATAVAQGFTNDIAGVRNLLGNQSITDGQLVPPVPNRGSWDAFWSTLKGTGIKQAYFEFRSRRVEQDQKMFEWYSRLNVPNVPVAFECGAFTGNQAVINGTTEVLTIASTADLVKENPTWGDNWEMKADIGRGLKTRFTGDADGSLRRSNGMWALGGYSSPGIFNDIEIAKKMVKMLEGNGYLGVFGSLANFLFPLRQIKNNRDVAPAGLIGSEFATIYNTSTITYNSEEYRDSGSAKSLNNYKNRFTNLVQINSPWPQAA